MTFVMLHVIGVFLAVCFQQMILPSLNISYTLLKSVCRFDGNVESRKCKNEIILHIKFVISDTPI